MWSCGLLRHELDWKMEVSNLAVVKFFFRPGQKLKLPVHYLIFHGSLKVVSTVISGVLFARFSIVECINNSSGFLFMMS